MNYNQNDITIFTVISKYRNIIKEHNLRYLGTVKFEDEVIVCDPYCLPSSSNIKLEMEPGIYCAFIKEEYGIVFGNKIKELYVFNYDYSEYPSIFKDDIISESMECGFFDSHYFDVSLWGRIDQNSDVYQSIHNITHPCSNGRLFYGGILDNRCVVSSATINDDNKYKLFIAENNGKIISAKLEY